VPEVIEDGVNGFVVQNIEEAVAAIERVSCLDRAGCRKYFELRFPASRMCADYLAVYERLLRAEPAIVPATHGASSWLRSA
jgi:glycosyltransferase involved in cell wall biosynthesis